MTILLLALLCQDPDPKQVDEWIRQLGHEDFAVRDAAFRKLLDCGEKLLPLLEKHEKSDDAEVRARVADLRKRLTAPKNAVEGVLKLAEAAFAKDWKVDDWRPPMREALEKLLGALGEDIAKRPDAERAIRRAFEDGNPVTTENAAELKKSVAVIKKAQGKKVDRAAILLCESADFDEIQDCVVICLGDVKVRRLDECVILARGKIEVGADATQCVVYAGGAVSVADELRENTFVALGGIEGGRSKGNVLVNTPKFTTKDSSNDRMVTNDKLPQPKK